MIQFVQFSMCFRESKENIQQKKLNITQKDPLQYNLFEELAQKYGKTHVIRVKTMEEFETNVI